MGRAAAKVNEAKSVKILIRSTHQNIIPANSRYHDKINWANKITASSMTNNKTSMASEWLIHVLKNITEFGGLNHCQT